MDTALNTLFETLELFDVMAEEKYEAARSRPELISSCNDTALYTDRCILSE